MRYKRLNKYTLVVEGIGCELCENHFEYGIV